MNVWVFEIVLLHDDCHSREHKFRFSTIHHDCMISLIDLIENLATMMTFVSYKRKVIFEESISLALHVKLNISWDNSEIRLLETYLEKTWTKLIAFRCRASFAVREEENRELLSFFSYIIAALVRFELHFKKKRKQRILLFRLVHHGYLYELGFISSR